MFGYLNNNLTLNNYSKIKKINLKIKNGRVHQKFAKIDHINFIITKSLLST